MVFFPSPPFSRSTILFNKKSDVTPFEYKEAEVLAPKTWFKLTNIGLSRENSDSTIGMKGDMNFKKRPLTILVRLHPPPLVISFVS